MISTVLQKPLSLSTLLIANESLVPPVINKHAKESERLVQGFMEEYALVFPQLPAVITMSAYLFPYTSLERLTLIGALNCLLYYIDDIYGDLPSAQGLPGEPISRDVLKIIEDCCLAFSTGQINANSSALAQAFYNLHPAIASTMNQALFERLVTSLTEHLLGSVKPAIYGWNPATTGMEDYIRIREFLSGMYPMIDLIEYADDIPLHKDIIVHPLVARLRQACARIGGLTNDLFSYEKEVIRCDLPMNLIRVIEQDERSNFAAAAERAIEFINKETQIFFGYAEYAVQWDTDTNALLDRYVEGMKAQLSATWNWQMSTPRYRSPESPFEELRV